MGLSDQQQAAQLREQNSDLAANNSHLQAEIDALQRVVVALSGLLDERKRREAKSAVKAEILASVLGSTHNDS